MISAHLCWFCSLRGVIAALPVLIHARLHGCAGSSCPEQNHTANTNSMQLSFIFDNSGPDRSAIHDEVDSGF